MCVVTKLPVDFAVSLSCGITYLPHKAVAEVSKNKEPIGRECAEFNWFESQLMSDSSEVRFKWCGLSSDLRFKWFWLSIDLRFKWFGCQSMCASNDFGCLLFWTSSDVVVNWFEIQVIRLSIDLRFQMIWLSIDLRFKWVGCQLIWDSNDLDVKWFEVQVIWLPTDAWFKWFCQTKLFCEIPFKIEALKLKNEAFVRDFLQKSSFEDQNQKGSNSARLPSKLKLWSWKTKRLRETSFKNQALKIKNEAFLRDFLQKSSFEDQKRSISARLPSKMKLWSSKTKHFCETSFKIEALKLKNEAFLRDFLQKWHVDQTLDLRITILFNDFQVDASKVLRLPRKSCAEAYELL